MNKNLSFLLSLLSSRAAIELNGWQGRAGTGVLGKGRAGTGVLGKGRALVTVGNDAAGGFAQQGAGGKATSQIFQLSDGRKVNLNVNVPKGYKISTIVQHNGQNIAPSEESYSMKGTPLSQPAVAQAEQSFPGGPPSSASGANAEQPRIAVCPMPSIKTMEEKMERETPQLRSVQQPSVVRIDAPIPEPPSSKKRASPQGPIQVMPMPNSGPHSQDAGPRTADGKPAGAAGEPTQSPNGMPDLPPGSPVDPSQPIDGGALPSLPPFEDGAPGDESGEGEEGREDESAGGPPPPARRLRLKRSRSGMS